MTKIRLAVDIILLTYARQNIKILLVKRKHPPFEGCWALPGGMVEEDETVYHAACRELEEETNIKNIELSFIPSLFDKPTRDPRGRVISMIFWGFLRQSTQAKAGSDASMVNWFSLDKLPALAFDHEQILSTTKAYITSLYNSSSALLKNVRYMKVEKLIEIMEKL